MKNCDYGCEQQGQYILKSGKICCSQHVCQCPSIRKKNSEKLKYVTLKYGKDFYKLYESGRIA